MQAFSTTLAVTASSTSGRIRRYSPCPTTYSVITTRRSESVSYRALCRKACILPRPGWTDNVVAEGTIHHNWFDGTNQRNPSADNLLHAHFYNNYLSGVTSYGHYARGSTDARIENVYFVDTADPITAEEGATLTSTGIIVEGDSGEPAANQGEAFVPADLYEYAPDATEDVPSIVQGSAGPQADVCS